MRFLVLASLFMSLGAFALPCDNNFRLFEERYGIYQDAMTVAKKRTELLSEIRWWQTRLGKRISINQAKRIEIHEVIENSLQVDNFRIAVEYLEPMSNRIQLAYHIIKQNKVVEAELAELLKKNPLDEKAQKMIQDLYEENLKQAKVVARDIEEYAEAMLTLQQKAKGAGAEAEHAKLVLDKLQSQYVLDSFFAAAKIAEKETPMVKQIYQILDEFVEADLYHLKLRKRKEMISVFAYFRPSKILYRAISKVVAKTPWINESKLRALFEEIGDSEIQLLYSPEIAQLIGSEAETIDKFKLMMNINVSSNDLFIETFYRRLDARDLWKEMKTYAQEAEPKFFARMEKVEKSGDIKGELSLFKKNSGVKIMSRFVDFVVASALVGTPLYLGLSDAGQKEVDKKAKELTAEEEKELDDTLSVAKDVIIEADSLKAEE